ncbi:hypothetical protein BVRB_2g033690 [Beta vulgaris subsp. vulgaris]|nr:hypothetical protein BVRB_2g033690 [Beta vulgaris subsp. vulgaris]
MKCSRRQSAGSSMLAKEISEMTQRVKLMSQSSSTTDSSMHPSMFTISAAMNIINRMIDDHILEKISDLWFYATNLIENATKREVFLSMEEDTTRLIWLQRLRGKPKAHARGNPRFRRPFPARRFNPRITSSLAVACDEQNFPRLPSSSAPAQHFGSGISTANAFESLTEFQINAEDNVQLHPPLHSHPLPETEATPPLDEDDLDDEFLGALGVVHHNPNLLLDADMTEGGSVAANLVVAPGDSTAPDGLKRRKQDDFEAPSPSSPSTI